MHRWQVVVLKETESLVKIKKKKKNRFVKGRILRGLENALLTPAHI